MHLKLFSQSRVVSIKKFFFSFLDPRYRLALILFQMVSDMLPSWKRNNWKQIIESNVDFQGENVFFRQNGHTFLTKIWHNWLFGNAENVFLFLQKKAQKLDFWLAHLLPHVDRIRNQGEICNLLYRQSYSFSRPLSRIKFESLKRLK